MNKFILGLGRGLLIGTVLGALFLLLTSCGKDVKYGVPSTGEETTIGGLVNCLTNCDTGSGPVAVAPPSAVKLKVRLAGMNHNVKLCSKFQLVGSGGKKDLGCNNNPKPAVVIQSNLNSYGSCQRVRIWTVPTPLVPNKFNSYQHSAHYKACDFESKDVWVSIENHNGGVADYNDSRVLISNDSDNRKLSVEYVSASELRVCLED